jgi:hypothetical protein
VSATPGEITATVRTPFIRLGTADTVWAERQHALSRDADGRLSLCGIPRDATVQLKRASAPATDVVTVRLGAGEYMAVVRVP